MPDSGSPEPAIKVSATVAESSTPVNICVAVAAAAADCWAVLSEDRRLDRFDGGFASVCCSDLFVLAALALGNETNGAEVSALEDAARVGRLACAFATRACPLASRLAA